MPNYDFRCPQCASELIDILEPYSAPAHICACGTTMERAWLTHVPSVIGDEIDIYIKHGICHEDGTPRRFRSKQEMKRVTKEKGLVNRVEHVGRAGGDRSKHTSRWY